MPLLRFPALRVRLRPTGPWRIGPDTGARYRAETVYHSDSLFSAVSSAMERLGVLAEWLSATAGGPGTPAVRFSSCFPWQGELLFLPAPRSMWPPPSSVKLRWKGARFLPVSLIAQLFSGQLLNEDDWVVDAGSECLIPAARSAAGGPLRITMRSRAAVDRLAPGQVDPHTVAAIEFARDAGFWTLAVFRDEDAMAAWRLRVEAALRFLADSGFGGERSHGWGRSETPEFETGHLPDLLSLPAAQAES